jgi:hypothetical protein
MDLLLAYRLSGGLLTLPAFAHGIVRSPGHPGGSLTISANGSTTNTGIVWASIPTFEDAKHRLTAGTLRAFHAETLTEIWTSVLRARSAALSRSASAAFQPAQLLPSVLHRSPAPV